MSLSAVFYSSSYTIWIVASYISWVSSFNHCSLGKKRLFQFSLI